MDQFRRHETPAKDYMTSGQSGTPSRFDASFYRTHDALSFIPSDVQSLRSQATYSSGLPMFTTGGPFGPGASRGVNGAKRSAYGSYASSIISQDAGPSGSITDNSSVVGSAVGPSERNMGMAYSQSDRLRRRTSFSSVAGASDMGSLSQYDYKSQDEAADMDDMKSQYAGTQSGVTVY
jgi:regulator of nonsense transcripts 1